MANILIPTLPAPAAGQLPVTALWLGYSATPGAAPGKLTTEAGFSEAQVAASTVATDAGPIVAAWAALITAIRSLFPSALIHVGADDGQVVSWSPGIVPSAQAAFECVVSGRLDEPWRSGAYTVTATLAALVTAGGEQYPRTGYTGAVGTDGVWSLTLPRGVTADFRFPDRSTLRRVIPDAGAADFGELAAAD